MKSKLAVSEVPVCYHSSLIPLANCILSFLLLFIVLLICKCWKLYWCGVLFDFFLFSFLGILWKTKKLGTVLSFCNVSSRGQIWWLKILKSIKCTLLCSLVPSLGGFFLVDQSVNTWQCCLFLNAFVHVKGAPSISNANA